MIREAIEEDCSNMAALSIEVYLSTYAKPGIREGSSEFAVSTFTKDYFSELIKSSKCKVLVSVEGIFLRGIATIDLESKFEIKDNGFEITRLYVHSPYQGRGIGPNLLSEIKHRYGSRFWLYTWVENQYQIKFYRKFGFKHIGKHSLNLGDDIIENLVFGYVGT